MRCLLKVEIPVDVGNARMLDGTFGKIVESILADCKPESAYFYEENGARTGLIAVEVKDPSHIPSLAEPWFLNFDARVKIHPAMTLQDLKNAGPGIEKAIQNFRKTNMAAA